MQFRQHRSSLRESLDTTIEIDNSFETLENKVRELFPYIGDSIISVVHYAYDERLEQDVFSVFTNEHGVLGFVDEAPTVDASTALFGYFVLNDFISSLVTKINNDYVFDWELLKKHRGLNKHPDVINLLRNRERLELDRPIGRAWETYAFQDHIGLLPGNTVDHKGNVIFTALENTNKPSRLFCIRTSLDNKNDVLRKFIRVLPLIAEDWYLMSIHRWDVDSRLPDIDLPQKGKNGRLKNKHLAGRVDMDSIVDVDDLVAWE